MLANIGLLTKTFEYHMIKIMKTEVDINEFVTFKKLKNGTVKVTHDKNNEANIAKHLHKLGYGVTKLNSKTVFFKKENERIIPVGFEVVKRAFYKIIRNFEYINLPENVSPIDISDWYLSKHPIKKSELFKYHLGGNLTESEIKILLS